MAFSNVRPISNTYSLSWPPINVSSATAVWVVNSGTTDRTVYVSNTAGPENGGGKYDGTGAYGITSTQSKKAEVFINGGDSMVIMKKSSDTMFANADVKAVKIASSGA